MTDPGHGQAGRHRRRRAHPVGRRSVPVVEPSDYETFGRLAFGSVGRDRRPGHESGPAGRGGSVAAGRRRKRHSTPTARRMMTGVPGVLLLICWATALAAVGGAWFGRVWAAGCGAAAA